MKTSGRASISRSPRSIQLVKAAKDGRHGHRDATLILIAFRHGLRAVEIANLRMVASRVRPQRRLARPPGQERDLSVHPLQGDELRALRELHRHVPRSPLRVRRPSAADRLHTRTPSTCWSRPSSKRSGLPFPVHVHMLRHACGYALANAGHDTRRIQSLGSGTARSSTRCVTRNCRLRRSRPLEVKTCDGPKGGSKAARDTRSVCCAIHLMDPPGCPWSTTPKCPCKLQLLSRQHEQSPQKSRLRSITDVHVCAAPLLEFFGAIRSP